MAVLLDPTPWGWAPGEPRRARGPQHDGYPITGRWSTFQPAPGFSQDPADYPEDVRPKPGDTLEHLEAQLAEYWRTV